MISEKQTNFVYLSRVLASDSQLSSLWKSLKEIFDDQNVQYELLDNVETIQIKDSMPLQATETGFVAFASPSDFDEGSSVAQLSDKAIANLSLRPEQCDVAFHARDIVVCDRKAVISDKSLFINNSKDKKQVTDELLRFLRLTEVSVVPLPRKGFHWQITDLLRLMNNNTLLVSDLTPIKRSWVKDFEKSLHETDKLLMPFPSAMRAESEQGDYQSTKGCYLNFVQIGSLIVFPQYGVPEDEPALKMVKKLYPYCKVFSVDCNVLAERNLGLNAIMWNVKK